MPLDEAVDGQAAMDSGAVSAQASFSIIEDDAGNTFLSMQGQANEWATYLASQGRIAAEALLAQWTSCSLRAITCSATLLRKHWPFRPL